MMKRMIERFFATLMLSLIIVPSVTARLRMTSVSNRDGLSDSSVSCLFQDSKGRLWVGTWDGLNLYTGATCKTFRHVPGNSETVPGSIIMSIDRKSVV